MKPVLRGKLLMLLIYIDIIRETSALLRTHIRSAEFATEVLVGRHMKDYAEYGNYCGPGGSGPALDQIDRCCMKHDHCYSASELIPGCNPFRASSPFALDLTYGEMLCASNTNVCNRYVCQCDRHFVECIKDNDMYYHRNLHSAGNIIRRIISTVLG